MRLKSGGGLDPQTRRKVTPILLTYVGVSEQVSLKTHPTRHVTGSGESRNFEGEVGGERQCISPVIIYHKCKQQANFQMYL